MVPPILSHHRPATTAGLEPAAGLVVLPRDETSQQQRRCGHRFEPDGSALPGSSLRMADCAYLHVQAADPSSNSTCTYGVAFGYLQPVAHASRGVPSQVR